MATLIYAGAAFDSDFLPIFQDMGYNKFVLYDLKPNNTKNPTDNYGQKYDRNRKLFFSNLITIFGPVSQHDKVKKIVFFQKNSIEYHYSCDINSLKRRNLPRGDILIRKFEPRHWCKDYVLEGRQVFHSCDSVVLRKDWNKPEKVCFCSQVDESSNDDQEEEQSD